MNINFVKKPHIIGFISSIILTIVPFIIIKYYNNINQTILTFILSICALMQIIIHFIFFIHLNAPKKQPWHFISLIFTTLIIFLLILGSLWIMHHLNHNLMH